MFIRKTLRARLDMLLMPSSAESLSDSGDPPFRSSHVVSWSLLEPMMPSKLIVAIAQGSTGSLERGVVGTETPSKSKLRSPPSRYYDATAVCLPS